MIRKGIYTLVIAIASGILFPTLAQPRTDTTWKRGGNMGIHVNQVSLIS